MRRSRILPRERAGGNSRPTSITRFAARTATGPSAAIDPASSRAQAFSSSPFDARFTMPGSSASVAPKRRPVKIRSSAAASPTSRCRRWVPPAFGRIASEVSVGPNCAWPAAPRRSRPKRSAIAPPNANPLTTATVGRGKASTSPIRARMLRTKIGTRSTGTDSRCFKSAPARKARPPAPGGSTQRIEGAPAQLRKDRRTRGDGGGASSRRWKR